MWREVATIEDDVISKKVILIKEIKGNSENEVIIASHFENIVKHFLLNLKEPINDCDILIMLVYGLCFECGFIPFDSDIIPNRFIFSFNKELIDSCCNITIVKINETLMQIKLKHMLNLNISVLLIIIKMNQNLLITFNPENFSGRSIMIIVNDYVELIDTVYDNVENIVKVLKNLDKFDIRIKNELLLPIRSIVLDSIMNPSLTNIPLEIFLILLKYLHIIDISNLSLVNKLLHFRCLPNLNSTKRRLLS